MTLLRYRQLQRKALLAKWSKVDWSKSNAELADAAGLSRERLRQIRQRVGAPKPTHLHHRVRKSAEALQWAKDNLEKLKGLSLSELGRKYGLSRWQGSAVYQFLKPFLRNGRHATKHPWDLMNFSLPNGDLARIWRLPYSQVASHRSDNQRGRSRWRLKLESVCLRFRGRGQLQAYHRAVKAEERNAARHFAQA
jgi:hypothetical protein